MQAPDTSTVNVEDIMSHYQLDLFAYPNPAREQISFGFNNEISGKVRIELLDVTGAVVYVFDEKNMGAGRQVMNLNIASIPAGIYFIGVQIDIRVKRNLLLSKNKPNSSSSRNSQYRDGDDLSVQMTLMINFMLCLTPLFNPFRDLNELLAHEKTL